MAFIYFILQTIITIALVIYVYDKLRTISENKEEIIKLEKRITKLEKGK